jgi:hypothetical protein
MNLNEKQIIQAIKSLHKVTARHANKYWEARKNYEEAVFADGYNTFASYQVRVFGECFEGEAEGFANKAREAKRQAYANGKLLKKLENKADLMRIYAGALLQTTRSLFSRRLIRAGLDEKNFDKLTPGRTICQDWSAKKLIWHGRNQAIHPFDLEGAAVKQLSQFKESYSKYLTENYHADYSGVFTAFFDLSKRKSVAEEILYILGWNRFENIEKDLGDIIVKHK